LTLAALDAPPRLSEAAPKPWSIICLKAAGIASVAPAATSSAMPANRNWRR